MQDIIQAIKDLYEKIKNKDQEQIDLAATLSEKETSIQSREKMLEDRIVALKEREGACEVIENIGAAQKANREEKQKLSEERNELEEAKRKQAEAVSIQNQEIERERQKNAAETVALKASREGMEAEIKKRIEDFISIAKK